MENIELKKNITDVLDILTKNELEQLNDFLQYKKIKLCGSSIESGNIEISEEERIISFFNNRKIKIRSINELLFYMKWAKFSINNYGKIYPGSMRTWFREFFDMNNKMADEIINYLISSDYLSVNQHGYYSFK